MRKADSFKAASYFPGATTATAATAVHTVDTIGCSRAHIYVLAGSATTTSNVWEDVDVYHHTTTEATSGTLIAAASFGTETSTAASNVIPSDALMGATGGIIEINLDLKDRERYVGVKTTRGTTPGSAATGGVLVLLEPIESADTTTTKQLASFEVSTTKQAFATVDA